MALKFILSICVVLIHLKGHVAGSSVDVEDCMWVVDLYPEEAKGFAEVDATQEELKVAIESISKTVLDSRGNATKQDLANLKARVTSRLTECFEIRKVN